MMTTDEDSTGFVEGLWGSESAEHVRLKNLATMILLSEGISQDKIREESREYGNPVDIVAEQDDGSLIMIECETEIGSPPPTRYNVSFNQNVFDNGHQVFALTPEGLFELADRGGYIFVPIDSVQTTLQKTGSRALGRWFASTYAIEEIPETREERRWSTTSDRSMKGPQAVRPEKVEDNHQRWRADGVKPDPEQPSIAEIAGWDKSRIFHRHSSRQS
jgi:hypothetical protein